LSEQKNEGIATFPITMPKKKCMDVAEKCIFQNQDNVIKIIINN
jgi:hypothetical protein